MKRSRSLSHHSSRFVLGPIVLVGLASCTGDPSAVSGEDEALLGVAGMIDDLPIPVERTYEGRGRLDIAGNGFGLRALARTWDRGGGMLHLAALELDGDDGELRGGFLGAGRQVVRGLHGESTAPVELRPSGTGRWVTATDLELEVRAYRSRDAGGVLREPIVWERRTIRGLTLELDASGQLVIVGDTSVAYDGDLYGVRFHGTLPLVNTSPEAFGGPATDDALANPFDQHDTPGCPVKLPDGSPGILEMNHEGGWLGAFVDGSWDPDGDSVVDVHWRVVSADGMTDRVSTDSLFRLDLVPGVYRSSLWVRDARGSGDRDVCTFRVADTTGPTITASPLAAECDARGGLSRSSDAVTTWLARASALDATGVAGPVTMSTPVGDIPLGDSTVRLTSRDAAGNEGTLDVAARVVDTTPPWPWSSTWPERVRPDGSWQAVELHAGGWDLCSEVTVTLASAYASPGVWVWGAAPGPAPSSVWVLATEPGRLKLAFRVTDAAGNDAWMPLVVPVGGAS
jgi:hypothetical protein